jgi:hypothetical protein
MYVYARGRPGRQTWPAGEESLVAAVVEVARDDVRDMVMKIHQGSGEGKRSGGGKVDHTLFDCAAHFLTRIRIRIEDEPTKPGGPDEWMGLFAALYAMMTP